jgi:hypothetical protein
MSSPPGPARRVTASLLLPSFLPVLDISTRGEARSVDLSLGGASEAAKSTFRDKKPATTSRAFCQMENARKPAQWPVTLHDDHIAVERLVRETIAALQLRGAD